MRNEGKTRVSVDDDTILTPSAKDLVREYGMKLTQGETAEDLCRRPGSMPSGEESDEDIDPELVYRVLVRLKEKGLLEDFIKSLGSSSSKESDAMTAPSDLIGQKQLNDMILSLQKALKGE
jgi:hypothetical protein